MEQIEDNNNQSQCNFCFGIGIVYKNISQSQNIPPFLQIDTHHEQKINLNEIDDINNSKIIENPITLWIYVYEYNLS
ncbi:hypothetical protein BpHYR1_028292 [Brachionus plicatilis]|uniref:Uncharacterized protein n=1 Tax=Brachionus plicatilis TaxID=10195 RepID=A0A3M7R938_BRAPC|nr:hypothetical protein BpHYR1_028292 [Brachionus plicatilis]